MGRTAYEAHRRFHDNGHRPPLFPDLERRAEGGLLSVPEDADWANTTIAAGAAEEIDGLRLGGDGHIVVWGGVSHLVSSTASSNGVLELQYRRHR